MISLSSRLRDTREYYFSRKLEEIRAMNDRGLDVINLGIGSPDLMPNSTVIGSAIESIQNSKKHGYAPYRSTPELRLAISQWYQRTYKLKCDPSTEVLPLLGSKEGIFYALMALCDPGDKILIPNPGYPAYSAIARLIGLESISYTLSEVNEWKPDFSQITKLIKEHKPKVLWINYPHMPSGASLDRGSMEKLLEICREHRIFLCNDNPYSLILNTSQAVSLLSLDPGFENSLELNSLSKSHNMAGWRVGMAISNSRVIQGMLTIKSNIDTGMFLPIQDAAISALALDDSWHEERNQIYKARRKIAEDIFHALDIKFSKNQSGLFLWGALPNKNSEVSEKYCENLLQKAHIFLSPGSLFGSAGEGYLRLSLCSPENRLQEALRRIKQMKKGESP